MLSTLLITPLFPRWLGGCGLVAALLLNAAPLHAQGPVATAVIPAVNAVAAPRSGPVQLSFAQPLNANAAGALHVFSAWHGGQRTAATPAVVSGTTLTYQPPAGQPFLPGETVSYTLTRQATGSGGAVRARVGQFTAAAAPAPATFVPGPVWGGGSGPVQAMSVADVDGDRDLDLLLLDPYTDAVLVRLSDGTGAFSGGQDVAFGPSYDMSLGDVDGDGDLDLVVLEAGRQNTALSVRLNNGRGYFSGSQSVVVNAPARAAITLADVDADGDLDLLVADYAASATVGICLNDGQGNFSPTSSVPVNSYPVSVALADVDADGDLDLLTNSSRYPTVSIRLNDGLGSFSGSQEVSVAPGPSYDMSLGDVDGDGDVDLLTTSAANATVSLRLNNGAGTFGGSQTLPMPGTVDDLKLGDLDGDGDLDLAAMVLDNSFDTMVFCLNDGNGTFGPTQSANTSDLTTSFALADADGDGDLDIIAAANFLRNGTLYSAAVYYNQRSTPTATQSSAVAPALRLFPNPAHDQVRLTGAQPGTTVQLYDLTGRLVQQTRTAADGTASLRLPTGLRAGVYWVRSGAHTQRLLVE